MNRKWWITTLLEMCFADLNLGAKIDSVLKKKTLSILFAENIGIVFQAKDDATLENKLNANGVISIN
jgi:phosphoribosylformylglycinamidine synthase